MTMTNPFTEIKKWVWMRLSPIQILYSWFHRPSVLYRISIGTQVTCTYITWLPRSIEITPVTTKQSRHVLKVRIKTQKNLFCKQTGLYILHKKWDFVVRDHLAPLCMFIVTSKINFMFFKQQPVIVYILTSVLSTSQHRCHWLSWCLC